MRIVLSEDSFKRFLERQEKYRYQGSTSERKAKRPRKAKKEKKKRRKATQLAKRVNRKRKRR
ncbi:MAG: hypothetical protein DRP97_05250 [Candidatus Latescibacterota bacterium]|nr:MAG: hypothetical protein DRP97_05250 [Candidatus Latescibacterota bacterium]